VSLEEIEVTSNEQTYERIQTYSNEQTNTNLLVCRKFIDNFFEAERGIADILYKAKVDAMLEFFKFFDAFQDLRSVGFVLFTSKIRFLSVFLFSIITFSSLFNSVVFVQLLVASLLCIVLLVHHFIKMSTKVMLKYLKNDCYDLEGAVEFSIFLHNN